MIYRALALTAMMCVANANAYDLENESLRLQVDKDGRVTVHDKRNGTAWIQAVPNHGSIPKVESVRASTKEINVHLAWRIPLVCRWSLAGPDSVQARLESREKGAPVPKAAGRVLYPPPFYASGAADFAAVCEDEGVLYRTADTDPESDRIRYRSGKLLLQVFAHTHPEPGDAFTPGAIEKAHDYGYGALFTDCTTAGDSMKDCYDPAHPLTRAAAAEALEGSLQAVTSQGMVVGSERGFWWAAADCHYFEGIGKYKLLHNLAYQLENPAVRRTGSIWQGTVRRGLDRCGKRALEDCLFHPQFELYDLEADPHEVDNLAGDPRHAQVLNELRDKLRVFQTRTKDPWLRFGLRDSAWPTRNTTRPSAPPGVDSPKSSPEREAAP